MIIRLAARSRSLPSSLLVCLVAFTGWTLLASPAHAQLVRRNLKNLNANSPEIVAFQRAIAAMKRLPDTDPHSWNFQANIHGYPEGTPNPSPNWNQCQHANWWFLPWHRAYLYYFERIVRLYSGDPNFTLPYWDYADATQRFLPAMYRTPSSQLYDGTRRAGINNGTDQLSEFIVVRAKDLSMSVVPFADYNTRVTTFGGPAMREPQHLGSTPGTLENLPHNWIHGFIGGNMGSPETAARDPIFWAHHANIDRLWEEWLQMGNGRANPSDPVWHAQTFTFYDESKRPVTITMGEVANTTSLGYVYEDNRTPVANDTQSTGRTTLVRTASLQPVRERELTSALTFELTPTPESRIALQSAAGPRRIRSRVYLCLDGVQFSQVPDSSVSIYLNGARGNNVRLAPTDNHFAGYLAYFGHAHHGGHHSTLDVTDTVDRLERNGSWQWDKVNVTLQRVVTGSRPYRTSSRLTFHSLELYTSQGTSRVPTTHSLPNGHRPPPATHSGHDSPKASPAPPRRRGLLYQLFHGQYDDNQRQPRTQLQAAPRPTLPMIIDY